MRATFSGLNTMVKGIFSNQLSLDTTGHNITNAGTEGYSRQGVNLAATRGQQQSSLYGEVLVGTGVDSMSIERARNFYADLQYWSESSTKKYYETLQVNYDKVETVFNDSDNSGIQNAMEEFYSSWVNLSTNATDSAARVAVVEKGKTFSDAIQTAATLMKDQINAEYDDMKLNLTKFNDLSKQVTVLNKSILVMEAGGAKANDLRDQRDLIVDKMSEYINLNVYEDEMGRYTVVSNGITLVHGDNHMDLKMSEPAFNRAYATNDYSLEVADTGIVFQPTNGYFKAKLDNVAINKSYIDDLSNMAAQLLTVFNDQHKLGVGVDNASTTGLNFFGQNTGPEGYKFTPSGGSEVECNMTVYAWDDKNHCLVETPAYKDFTFYDKNGKKVDSAVVDGDIETKYTLTNDKSQITTRYGMEIIEILEVASDFTAYGGQNKVAARNAMSVEVWGGRKDEAQVATGFGEVMEGTNRVLTGSVLKSLNGTGDGSNAVLLSTLFNVSQPVYEGSANAVVFTKNADGTGDVTHAQTYATTVVQGDGFGMNGFYGQSMSHLANESEGVDIKAAEQDDIMTQIVAWRSSTAGVDWNEELTNMLMFQKGYSACARCLTTMDEMLDRLINNTGMVGR